MSESKVIVKLAMGLLTHIQKGPKDRTQGKRNNNMCIPLFGVVDHEQRYRRNYGYRKFVSPADIEDIVQKSQHSRH